MFRTCFALILIPVFFLLYWIGLEIPSSLDNIFLILGIFPTLVLLSMFLATKSKVESKNGRSIKFMRAVSGFPHKSFILRTLLPLLIITIYLGVRLRFLTNSGTSMHWNTWVASVFYLGMTIMILSYIKPIDFSDIELPRYARIMMIITKVIIYLFSIPTVIVVIFATFGSMNWLANLKPQLDSFLYSRFFVPFDLLLLTITIIALKPKEK